MSQRGSALPPPPPASPVPLPQEGEESNELPYPLLSVIAE